MKHLLPSGCVTLGLCAFVAVLEGCGGSQTLLGAPGTTARIPAAAATRSIALLGLPPRSFKVLHYFSGGRDGLNPLAGLVNLNGVLYGTTEGGGGGSGCYTGCGTVYSIGTTGKEKVLYSFAGGSDGEYPWAGLVNAKGTLYGTTQFGGVGKCVMITMRNVFYGCGTVYSISTTGKENVLYSFAGGSDGEYPQASLINVNGTLYGTTELGGAGLACYDGRGCGTIYRVSTTGKEKVLFSFRVFANGRNPGAGLLDVKGTLYGTTDYGGSSDKGTVYSISKTGANFSVLHSFAGHSDGSAPNTNVIDVKGTLYGTTGSGGDSGCGSGYGCGTVYSISTTGSEKVVYSFKGGTDGSGPDAGLIDVNGKLYSTTGGGGSKCGCGTVYSVTTAGSEKVLHAFDGSHGGLPVASLVKLKDAFYGTTLDGGTGCSPYGCGVVFVLTP